MSDAEFDRYADQYQSLHAKNVRLSGEEPAYFAEYKAQDALRLSEGRLPTATVLDFGTGIGNAIPYLNRAFPSSRIIGLDVSERSLDVARRRFAALAEFRAFEGDRIPAADGELGLVFAACVFHHIEPDRHPSLLTEIHRSLAPGGWLVLHEHNPWNPLTMKAVRDCPFDENAILIRASTMRQRAVAAGFPNAKTQYRLFFPSVLKMLRPMERALTWLPLGAQYCLSARK
jgi:SAM-dependent methyltransferase